MEPQVVLGDVLVDCLDEIRLRDFYAELLHWGKARLYGHAALRSATGVVLLFAQEDDYMPPVWPEEQGKQQKQLHFDFQVPDVWEAVRRAESLGAVRAKAQYGGNAFVTMFDPAGHPFCLCAPD